ncbi:hypothetical protein MRB53_023172 [Persea americana]|uniref:Uncharacterized protein n=1 Tax=Persea americana TaxID=3435 RepID=A0ACC2L9X4_PERAE|nr:hypothetical protein MRB53_023172 [Persea americana]
MELAELQASENENSYKDLLLIARSVGHTHVEKRGLTCVSTLKAAEVFSTDSAESEKTRGSSRTDSMQWPRARTSDGTANVARVKATANEI